MGERIAKLEENFDVKFNGHKVDVQTFIQNLFAEFKEEMFPEHFFSTNRGQISLNRRKPCFSSRKKILKSAMCTSESNIEELEQYGRKLCLHIESVPVVENETSEDFLNNDLDMCKKGISIALKMILIKHIELVNPMWIILVKDRGNL